MEAELLASPQLTLIAQFPFVAKENRARRRSRLATAKYPIRFPGCHSKMR
jgi:hypothetical protein